MTDKQKELVAIDLAKKLIDMVESNQLRFTREQGLIANEVHLSNGEEDHNIRKLVELIVNYL